MFGYIALAAGLILWLFMPFTIIGYRNRLNLVKWTPPLKAIFAVVWAISLLPLLAIIVILILPSLMVLSVLFPVQPFGYIYNAVSRGTEKFVAVLKFPIDGKS